MGPLTHYPESCAPVSHIHAPVAAARACCQRVCGGDGRVLFPALWALGKEESKPVASSQHDEEKRDLEAEAKELRKNKALMYFSIALTFVSLLAFLWLLPDKIRRTEFQRIVCPGCGECLSLGICVTHAPWNRP
jgi:hypothetical protein